MNQITALKVGDIVPFNPRKYCFSFDGWPRDGELVKITSIAPRHNGYDGNGKPIQIDGRVVSFVVMETGKEYGNCGHEWFEPIPAPALNTEIEIEVE